VGKRSEISYQEISELKYCSAVFKEALRLWPPVAFLSRTCTHEWEVDGYYVPKDTFIVVSSYTSARNESFFKNAYEFKPERFLKDAESNESRYRIWMFNLKTIMHMYLCNNNCHFLFFKCWDLYILSVQLGASQLHRTKLCSNSSCCDHSEANPEIWSYARPRPVYACSASVDCQAEGRC
jgi:hypothetical protein